MRYFKIQKGYDQDDYISIDETELGMALRAQLSGKNFVGAEGSVAGNHIISITPDWGKMMGYHRGHRLNADDYAEIGASKQEDVRMFLSDFTENMKREIKGLPPLASPPKMLKTARGGGMKPIGDLLSNEK